MDHHELPYATMTTMGYHVPPWTTMDHHARSWTTMESPWAVVDCSWTMEVHVLWPPSWTTTDHHEQLRTVHGDHGPPWTAVDVHLLPWTTKDCL